MKLSIIMVSYNEKDYIKEAIESCINQDFKDDYEIIIGDDGSDDGSISIIKEYQERYTGIIRYFVMDRESESDIIPSLRVTRLLKRGFSMAKGQYLSILSADDIFLDPTKFYRQVDFLDNNSKYISCYTDFKMFGENQPDIICEGGFSFGRSTFWSGKYVHISCFVFRNVVLKFLLDRFADDTGLIFSIFKAGKSRYIKGVSFGYRQRANSIMNGANRMKSSVLELMLYQDICNAGGYPVSSLSRIMRPLVYVYKNKKELENKEYNKYLLNCSCYPNNILGDIVEFKRLDKQRNYSLKKTVLLSQLYGHVFFLIRGGEKLIDRMIDFLNIIWKFVGANVKSKKEES